jgi:hypothetical protein
MLTRLAAGLIALLVVSACAISQEMVMPDGSQGYNISCDGSALSMGTCYQKAGDLCPQGYDILGQDGEAHPMGYSGGQLSGNTSYVQGGYVTTYGMMVTRNLYVRCKTGASASDEQ